MIILYACVFVYVCVCVCMLCVFFARGVGSFGHKIFFSLAVSVSLRRLLPEVRAYCKLN